MDRINTTLDDIAAVIGYSRTSRLVAWFGGTGVFVPQNPGGTKLEKLLGENAARKMSHEWPGEIISIPTDADFDADVRNAMIARFTTRGFSAKEIAEHTGLSERRVQQIRKALSGMGLIDVGRNGG